MRHIRRTDSLEEILTNLGVSIKPTILSCTILVLSVTNWTIETDFNELHYPIFQCQQGLDTSSTTLLRYLFSMAAAFGGLIFGMIADIRGRIGTLRFSIFIALYFRIFAMALSTDSFWQQLGSKLVIQFALGGSLIVSLLCLVETLPSNVQQKLILFSIALGLLLGNALVYSGNYHIHRVSLKTILQLILNVVLLFVTFMVGETIRYLKTSGDFNSVVDKLLEIAKSNKQILPKKLNLRYKNCQFGNLTSIFTKKPLYIIVFALLMAITLINNVILYQIYFTSILPMSYNLFRFDNTTLTSQPDCSSYNGITIEQYPSFFLPLILWQTIFMNAAVGFMVVFKKPLLLLVIIQSSVASLTIAFSVLSVLSQTEACYIILSVACKLTIVGPWIVLVFVNDLYQTHYRGSGLGFINFAGTLFSIILMMVFWSWLDFDYRLSMIVLASLSAFSCFLVCLCPTKSLHN